MIFRKGAYRSAKCQTFDCLGEISPNLYFDRLLLLKVYKISGKNVQRSYVSWYWRVVQNLKKNQFFVSKITRIWWILIRALKSLKNLHFDWSLLCKVYNIWPKKVQRSIFHDTEESCKIWRKTDLSFGKWHEEFGKFSPEHSKVSKLELWWDPFVQSRKCMSLKFTEKLCVMTMKNNAEFEEKLARRFKIDKRNLTNFESTTQKSQKFAL